MFYKFQYNGCIWTKTDPIIKLVMEVFDFFLWIRQQEKLYSYLKLYFDDELKYTCRGVSPAQDEQTVFPIRNLVVAVRCGEQKNGKNSILNYKRILVRLCAFSPLYVFWCVRQNTSML